MEYYKNFMADAVVKVDGDARYVKVIPDYKEIRITDPKNKTAFGGEGYGVFYILEPITKEQYNTFGEKWLFDRYGNIKLKRRETSF